MGTVSNLLSDNVRILLVEDSPTDAELIQMTLLGEIDALEFRRVDSDPDLRRSLVEFDPQIIISDYSMPGFSGLEALSICRVAKPEIPFIFVSGTIGEERAVDALKNGASDYVLKGSLSRLPHAVRQSVLIQRDKRLKKRQQEELARTYELLNSIFDTTHMMVAYMDTDFNFIQVNRSFSELYGSVPQYFTGKNFFDVVSDEGGRRKVFESVVRSGKAHFAYLDTALSGKDGKVGNLCFDWSIAPTKSYGLTEGLVFTCVDISERVNLKIERDELLRTLEERVEQRTAELNEANQRLASFNKDIRDSINYAKRIQDTFMPALSPSKLHVSDLFVVDLPKDVLSGDFHWSYYDVANDCTYVALGDCTGHGVPGSLMTLLAVQLLEQSIIGYLAKRSPQKVIHELNEAIVDFLHQREGTNHMLHDGMELALIRVDHTVNECIYASAGRAVYRFSSENGLERLPFTKMAVGGVIPGHKKEFEEFEFRFSPKDRVYVFTDGYVDQFGGESGTKFLRKRKEDYLLKIQSKPFSAHGPLLEKHILDWAGSNRQVDDIMILGIEF